MTVTVFALTIFITISPYVACWQHATYVHSCLHVYTHIATIAPHEYVKHYAQASPSQSRAESQVWLPYNIYSCCLLPNRLSIQLFHE